MTMCNRLHVDADGREYDFDEATITDENGLEVVEAMTRDNNPIGFKEGNFKHNLSGTLSVPKTGYAEIDKMHLDGTEFAVIAEFEGGQTRTYRRCRWQKVEYKASTGDVVKLSVDALMIGKGIN